MENNTISRKRKQFSTQIRSSQRFELLRRQRVRYQQKIKILNSSQQCNQWIQSKVKQVSQDPNSSCFQLIKDLSACMACFENFDKWVQTGLVKNLCKCFIKEYNNPYLASETSKLLSEIITLEIEKGITSIVAIQFLELGLFENLAISITTCQQLGSHCISQYLCLVDSLTHFNYEQMRKKQAFYLFIGQGLRIISHQQLINDYLDQMYWFLIFWTQKISENTFQQKEVALMFHFVETLFSKRKDVSTRMIEKMLYLIEIIFDQFTKITPPNNIEKCVSIFINFKRLFHTIIRFTINGSDQERLLSWQILVLVTSSTKLISLEFKKLKQDLLDVIQQSWNVDSQNKIMVRDNILDFIGNMAEQSVQMKELFFNSQMMLNIFTSTNQQNLRTIRIKAFSSFWNIIYISEQNSLIKSMRNSPSQFNKFIINGLKALIDEHATVLVLLRLLFKIIQTENELNKDTKILEKLESQYELPKLLRQIIQKTEQQEIMCLTNLLLDKYQDNQKNQQL